MGYQQTHRLSALQLTFRGGTGFDGMWPPKPMSIHSLGHGHEHMLRHFWASVSCCVFGTVTSSVGHPGAYRRQRTMNNNTGNYYINLKHEPGVQPRKRVHMPKSTTFKRAYNSNCKNMCIPLTSTQVWRWQLWGCGYGGVGMCGIHIYIHIY